MKFPEGSVILFLVWVAVVLVLWNLYRYSRALRKKTFVVLFVTAILAWVGGISLLFFLQHPRLPTNRAGLLIFPLVEETPLSVATNDSSASDLNGIHHQPVVNSAYRESDKNAPKGVKLDINPQGLAIADMIAGHLHHTPDAPFYIIPTDALFEVAHFDSLVYPDYILRFAALAELPVIGFGMYTKVGISTSDHKEHWQAEFQILDLRKTKAIHPDSAIHLNLTSHYDSLQAMAAAVAKAVLKEWTGRDEAVVTSIWQDNLSGDLLRRYYAVRFALTRNEPGAALLQARTFARADSNMTSFANLYARAMMAHLRRKSATKIEWEDSLRLVIPLLKRAVKRDSLCSESARLLGEAYIYLQKWNEAEHALLQARRHEPTDSKIYVTLGQLHASRLKSLGFRNELDLYNTALALNPIDVDAALAAAEFLLMENREGEAVKLLEKFRRLNPNHVGVLMSLGRLYIVKGETIKIFEVFERIVNLEPRNADAYYNLGIAYYNREDFENAIRFFERAIALNNHLNARMYLSYIYERQGDFDKAIYYLRERIRLSPGEEDKFVDEARRHLYEILLARGEIPPHLRPDSLKKR